MVGTTDSTSYDRFDFRRYDQEPLDLAEAVKKAAEMRKASPGYFYRVVPADSESIKFHIDKRGPLEVWVEWAGRLAVLSVKLVQLGSRVPGLKTPE